VLQRRDPDVRIINLETSVTTSEDYWPGKGINYRMHPENIGCITAARIDCCALANNHVLDWGYAGLTETLATLTGAGLHCAGAGRTAREAAMPATVVPGTGQQGRVILLAFGTASSGIPRQWAAADDKPGVNLLPDLSARAAQTVADQVDSIARRGDVVVASVHWGANWGYDIPDEQRAFSHRLIDLGAADIVYGHSSHHPKGIEVYAGKLILYGCGDLLNDYEGIRGHESFRADLSLLYFATIDLGSGRLDRLEMVPSRITRFALHRAPSADVRWLESMFAREGAALGTTVRRLPEDVLALSW
jgi:poly-gamma-glutamate capsule biosynthesis protein CapA/YwtB (metallophosphatase superfamily)